MRREVSRSFARFAATRDTAEGVRTPLIGLCLDDLATRVSVLVRRLGRALSSIARRIALGDGGSPEESSASAAESRRLADGTRGCSRGVGLGVSGIGDAFGSGEADFRRLDRCSGLSEPRFETRGDGGGVVGTASRSGLSVFGDFARCSRSGGPSDDRFDWPSADESPARALCMRSSRGLDGPPWGRLVSVDSSAGGDVGDTPLLTESTARSTRCARCCCMRSPVADTWRCNVLMGTSFAPIFMRLFCITAMVRSRSASDALGVSPYRSGMLLVVNCVSSAVAIWCVAMSLSAPLSRCLSFVRRARRASTRSSVVLSARSAVAIAASSASRSIGSSAVPLMGSFNYSAKISHVRA